MLPKTVGGYSFYGGLQSATGTRFAMTEVKRRPVTLRLHRNSQSNLVKIFQKEGMPMLTLESLIAVISLCLTSFGLGYAIGSNNSQK